MKIISYKFKAFSYMIQNKDRKVGSGRLNHGEDEGNGVTSPENIDGGYFQKCEVGNGCDHE